MKIFKLILILLAISLAPACAQAAPLATPGQPAAPPTERPSSQPEPTPSTQPPTQKPAPTVVINDALGRELEFERLPGRIAVAGRASQLILHAAYLFPEADERIVAMEQRVQREVSMIPLVDRNFDQKVQFERDVGAEGIAAAQPEAVLMKSYLADALGAPVETLGLTPVYMDLETPEQFFRDLKTLGILLGNPERADQIFQFYQARLEDLETMLDGLDDEERPRILLIQYSDRGGEVAFNVPSESWLQTEMVRLAGGEPVWVDAAQGGGWTIVNLEQIATWNPDMVFVVNYFGDPSQTVEELQADATWSELRAVQENRMYAVPGDFLSWDQPDPRWILALQWLATKIQPERTASVDMMEEFNTFFRELYDLPDQVIEDEIKPLLTGDFE